MVNANVPVTDLSIGHVALDIPEPTKALTVMLQSRPISVTKLVSSQWTAWRQATLPKWISIHLWTSDSVCKAVNRLTGFSALRQWAWCPPYPNRIECWRNPTTRWKNLPIPPSDANHRTKIDRVRANAVTDGHWYRRLVDFAGQHAIQRRPNHRVVSRSLLTTMQKWATSTVEIWANRLTLGAFL